MIRASIQQKERTMRLYIFALYAVILCACQAPMDDIGNDASIQQTDANSSEQERWETWRGFYSELNGYTGTQAWKGWVTQKSWTPSGEDPRKNRFFFPFTQARLDGGKTVKVLLTYEPDFSGYSTPFQGGEDGHLALLEEFLNRSYKGWDFQLKGGNGWSVAEADLVVSLGLPLDGTSYYDGGKTIHLVYETIVVHESLHWLWFWHHYCGAPWDDQSNCTEHPPDEGPCVMERQMGMGETERFILDIPPLTAEDTARIDAIASELLSHYPPHKKTAEEVCGTEERLVFEHRH